MRPALPYLSAAYHLLWLAGHDYFESGEQDDAGMLCVDLAEDCSHGLTTEQLSQVRPEHLVRAALDLLALAEVDLQDDLEARATRRPLLRAVRSALTQLWPLVGEP